MTWNSAFIFAFSIPNSEALAAAGTATAGVAAAAYKGFKPLNTWFKTTIREEVRAEGEQLYTTVDSMDSRVKALEHAVAPTNGDQRTISDRLDTVKYQTLVTNENVKALAQWLHEINPGSPPPIVHDLPPR